MKLHLLALVSPTNPKDVIGTLQVWATDIRAALKKVRTDPDMENVRCYPAETSARLIKADTSDDVSTAVAALTA